MLGESLLTRAAAWALCALQAALVLPVHTASAQQGAGTCAAAFEQWVKLSEQRVRKPVAEAGRDKAPPAASACLPGEAARKDLRRALAGVRAKCTAASAAEPTAPQTLTMIGINEEVLSAIALCPAEPKAETTAAPAPAPAPAPKQWPRSCLDIAPAAADRFLLVNKRCGGSRVLAIVEMRAETGATECRAHLIDGSKSVASAGKAPPHINYECPVAQASCTRERLAGMFPECEW